MPTHRAGELLAPVLDRLFAALLGEPLADLRPGAGALDEAEPVAAGSGVLVLRGEDLDGVAVLQFGVEGDEPAVDARAHRLVPHLGVDGVGEVDRCRTRGQAHDVALGVKT